MKNFRKRIADFLLYLMVAMLVLVAGVGLAIFAAKTGRDVDNVLPYLWAAASALVVFGYLIYYEKRLKGRSAFWLFVAGAVLLHFVMYWGVFSVLERASLLWLGLTIGPELVLLLTLADKLFYKKSHKSSH